MQTLVKIEIFVKKNELVAENRFFFVKSPNFCRQSKIFVTKRRSFGLRNFVQNKLLLYIRQTSVNMWQRKDLRFLYLLRTNRANNKKNRKNKMLFWWTWNEFFVPWNRSTLIIFFVLLLSRVSPKKNLLFYYHKKCYHRKSKKTSNNWKLYSYD